MATTEFRCCPACGYARGFHVALRQDAERTAIVLICPECGASYDLGWSAPRADVTAPVAGPRFATGDRLP